MMLQVKVYHQTKEFHLLLIRRCIFSSDTTEFSWWVSQNFPISVQAEFQTELLSLKMCFESSLWPLYNSFSVLSVVGVYDYSNYCLERLCETESQRESVRLVKSTRTFNLAEKILLKESSKKSLKHRMDSYR